jgi:hypothetical protein
MSTNGDVQSIGSINEKIRDSIPCRIEFVKGLLKGKKLEPLVDFENTDTEYFAPRIKDENASGESYDTRIVLKKRRLDFLNIIEQIGGKLRYIKSGTSGHTFKGQAVDKFGTFEYAIKVVAYPKRERYGSINDVRRPENAEILMIKLLSYFIAKKQTPHIVLPIGTFNTGISTFVNLIESNVVEKDNEKYVEFVKRYEEGEFHDNVSILISEWADRGDLLDFFRKHHNNPNFTATHWKVIFFQVLSVLAVIQSKYPEFRHNDLKANNVLVQKIKKQSDTFSYRVARCEYKVPSIGYYIKLWDFDFACIPGIVENKKVDADWTNKINVSPQQNRYYDIHYFFNTLIKRGFCSEIMTSKNTPQEVKDFIDRIVPPKYQKCGTKYVQKKGRLLVNDELFTADEILKNDMYFDEFRVKKSMSVVGVGTAMTQQILKKKPYNVKNQNMVVPVVPITKVEKKISGSNMPDLTKFLKNNSSDEKPKKIVKKTTEKVQREQFKVNELIKGGASKQTTVKGSNSKVIPKKIKKEKHVVKKSKVRSRSRTISEEINDLDPDFILNCTTSS